MIEKYKQKIIDDGCLLLSSLDGNYTTTKINIKCSCGVEFVSSTKQLYHLMYRKICTLSCGCKLKKWSNEAIKSNLITNNRTIQLVTDCDITGLSPSITKIEWLCNICNNHWFASVDPVINKKSGCPHCSGTFPYTLESLNEKLITNERYDLTAIELYKGSAKSGKKALFECTKCNKTWSALINNVIHQGYGCPPCNDNMGSRVEYNGIKFHSKLEYYFWKQYEHSGLQYIADRQKRYCTTRRFTCDFYFPELEYWVEICGKGMMMREKYRINIEAKKKIVKEKNQNLIILEDKPQINHFIQILKESISE